jgi:lysozyme family protein
MVASSWPISLKVCLAEEGGNDDDPNDHGGRTSRGITQREWDNYRKTHANLPEDVWKAPQGNIEDIYRSQYWNPYCDLLPAGVDMEFFDFGVNAGQSQAAKILQRCLGVNDDGHIGILTTTALKALPDINKLIREYAEARRNFYRNLAQFPRYGKGWLSRTDRVESAALNLSSSIIVAPRVVVDTGAEPLGKADPKDVAQTPIAGTTTAITTSASSGIAGGVINQITQLSTTLQSYTAIKYIEYFCLFAAVLGAGWAIYSLIHDNRVKQAVA